MAKTEALSIMLEDGVTLDELAEKQNQIIENVQKALISTYLKNNEYSGNPQAGSVVYKRFVNSAVKPYGTAALAGDGDAIKIDPVTINLDQNYEIVETVEKQDLVQYGIIGMVEKRQKNMEASLGRFLDTIFFAQAYHEGTHFTPSGDATTDLKKVEELLVSVETTANEYVDGVDRESLALILSTSYRSKLINEIVDLPQGHLATTAGAIGILGGTVVFDSNRLPKATGQVVDAIAMFVGAVGQPVSFQDMYVEKLQLKNKYGIELFFNYGCKAVMPDLIKYIGDAYSAS